MTPESTDRTQFRALKTLPVRVTGIVFWGLVVVGVLVVLTMLSGRESRIQQAQQAAVDRFMAEIYYQMTLQPLDDIQELSPLVKRLMKASPVIESASIHINGTVVRHGKESAIGVSYARPLLLAADKTGERRQVLLELQAPSIENQVKADRKTLLLGMGGLFLLFGLALQRVLDVVLTQPFKLMVNTARAILSGQEDVRFDDRRNDEFGYLGRFINKAMDYSADQKDALHGALERVRQSERALQEEKERAVVTLHSIGDAVITTDQRGNVEYMNPVAEELLGWRLEDIRNSQLNKIMRLVDEDSGRPLVNPVDLCIESGRKIIESGHKLLIRHDGREIAIADSAAPICDAGGKPCGVIMVFHDVGQARKLARQLSFQARHDPLTGLYNRREFESQLNRLLEGAQAQGQQHAVCYMDLDQFKVVNDVCGHGAGDELLRQLSGLLQSQVREADILARLGGDEFGLLLTHCNIGQAVRVAENIRSAIRDFRFLYEDRSFEIGVSIGVVAINSDSRSSAEILSSADIACYAAKDGGRNRVHLYEPSDTEMAQRRGEMNWVSVIRDALDHQRLYLLYQPIVPMKGDRAAQPSHYELLLRMRDPRGGEVLPMAFLPAAERFNLTTDIDCWVLDEAMRLLNDENDLPRDGTFLINLSGKSLCDPQFVSDLESRVATSPLATERICFEITEASAISNLRVIGEAIKRLRARGCRFALDDFGSGLSSFGYLKNLDIDFIKIDGGFVRDMVNDEMDAAMVRAINEIAHVIGVQTIAEFVETPAIFERLCELGVDYGQGHSIATPRPIEELINGGGHRPSLVLIKGSEQR